MTRARWSGRSRTVPPSGGRPSLAGSVAALRRRRRRTPAPAAPSRSRAGRRPRLGTGRPAPAGAGARRRPACPGVPSVQRCGTTTSRSRSRWRRPRPGRNLVRVDSTPPGARARRTACRPVLVGTTRRRTTSSGPVPAPGRRALGRRRPPRRERHGARHARAPAPGPVRRGDRQPTPADVGLDRRGRARSAWPPPPRRVAGRRRAARPLPGRRAHRRRRGRACVRGRHARHARACEQLAVRARRLGPQRARRTTSCARPPPRPGIRTWSTRRTRRAERNALLVVSGWADAADAARRRDAHCRCAQQPIRSDGTWLAPWLLLPGVVDSTAGAMLPLDFDIRDAAAQEFSQTLAKYLPGQAPTGSGFAAWRAARGGEPGPVRAVRRVARGVHARERRPRRPRDDGRLVPRRHGHPVGPCRSAPDHSAQERNSHVPRPSTRPDAPVPPAAPPPEAPPPQVDGRARGARRGARPCRLHLRRESGQVPGLLFVIGLALGFVLFHSRFGFTSGLAAAGRRPPGQGAARAHADARRRRAPCSRRSWPPRRRFGDVPAAPTLAPIGFGLFVGSFLFGVGMQLGGSCASGTLFAIGSGQTAILLTLAGFIGGSIARRLPLPVVDQRPAQPRSGLAGRPAAGYLGAWLISLAVMAAIVGAHLRARPARRRTARGASPGRPRCRPRDPRLVAAVGRRAAARRAERRSRSWSRAARGASPSRSRCGARRSSTRSASTCSRGAFWQDPANLAKYQAGFFAEKTSVMDFGIIIGALVASAAAGAFVAAPPGPAASSRSARSSAAC